MKKVRSRFKRVRRFLISAVVGLFLLLSVGWGLLQTSWLQENILQVAEGIPLPGELRMELDGPGGAWPFRLRLSEARIYDEQGLWLEASDLALQWKLSGKEIRIVKARANELVVKRQPVLKSTGDVKPPKNVQVRIESGVIETVRLDPQIAGIELFGNITFSVDVSPSLITFAGNLDSLWAELLLTGEGNPRARKGSLKVKGSVLGDLDLDLIAVAEEEALTVRGRASTKNLIGLYTAAREQVAPELPEFQSIVQELPVESEIDLIWKDGRLGGKVDTETPMGLVTTDVSVGDGQEEINVVARTENLSIDGIGSVIGLKLSGAASGEATYHRKAGVESVGMDLDLKQAGWKEIRAETMKVKGSLFPEVNLQLELQDLTHNEIDRVRSASMGIAGGPDQWEAHLQAESSEAQWQALELKGTGEWKENQGSFSVNEARVKLIGSPLELVAPMTFERDAGKWNLSPAQWSWGDVDFHVEAGGNGELVTGRLGVDALRMSLLDPLTPIDLDGAVSGEVTLQGTLSAPELALKIQGEKLRLDPKHQGPEMALQLNLEGAWTPEGVTVTTDMANARGDRFTADLKADAPWSLSPLDLPETDVDFEAKAEGTLSLAVFNVLPLFSEMKIEGLLETGFEMARTSGKFRVEGSLGLREGRFEHYGLGILFRNGEVDGVWRENRFVLERAVAETPGDGRLEISGNIAPENESWVGEMKATLHRARLLHLDAVQAALSGNVSLVKAIDSPPQLQGNLSLEETTFHLDRLPAASAEALDFRVVGAPEVEVTEPEEPPKSASPRVVEGSLRVRIPGTLRVEGKNVQTRWEGTLQALFSEAGLRLTGSLAPRRGTVMFFSRAFTLDRNGEILFSDRIDTPPILDLTATHNRPELEASLRITGRADNPDFQLQSTPPYPENEIISRILFGKDMSTITGLQALEVGLALNSMRDNNRGNFDVMGQVRDTLKVDQLEIRETGDSAGNPELMAGRQISDRVYLEVQQNLREPGTTMLLEVEVGKSVSVSSESGTHIRPGIGVSWRKDY